MKKPNRSRRQLKKMMKRSLLRLAHDQPEHFQRLVESASSWRAQTNPKGTE